MSQEKKSQIAPVVKEILKKYGLKWTLSVENYSTLVLKISAWSINFKEYLTDRSSNSVYQNWYHINVNVYWIDEWFEWIAKDALMELYDAMMVWNHDNSDAQVDYFDVGWYVDIKIGKWDKDYVLIYLHWLTIRHLCSPLPKRKYFVRNAEVARWQLMRAAAQFFCPWMIWRKKIFLPEKRTVNSKKMCEQAS